MQDSTAVKIDNNLILFSLIKKDANDFLNGNTCASLKPQTTELLVNVCLTKQVTSSVGFLFSVQFLGKLFTVTMCTFNFQP